MIEPVTVKISVLGVGFEQYKKLVEVLIEHIEELPVDVVSALKDLEKSIEESK